MKLEDIKGSLDDAGLLQAGLPKVVGEAPDSACAAAESCAVGCINGGMY